MTATRVALVTGGSRGIGEAIVRLLAARGAAVLVAARDAERAGEVAASVEEGGGRAWPLELDVTDDGSVAAAARRAAELAGAPVQWLVNNAGMAVSAPLVGEDDALYRRHLEVNFHGPRRLVEALLPAMREAGYGRIVNVASSAGLVGYAYVAAYCASKHALLGYTRAAALELEGSGVAISAVCPHYVDTPMVEESVARIVEKTGRSPEEARAFFAGQNPGGRLLTPGEVAEACLELLESESNGRVVELDGSAPAPAGAASRGGGA